LPSSRREDLPLSVSGLAKKVDTAKMDTEELLIFLARTSRLDKETIPTDRKEDLVLFTATELAEVTPAWRVRVTKPEAEKLLTDCISAKRLTDPEVEYTVVRVDTAEIPTLLLTDLLAKTESVDWDWTRTEALRVIVRFTATVEAEPMSATPRVVFLGETASVLVEATAVARFFVIRPTAERTEAEVIADCLSRLIWRKTAKELAELIWARPTLVTCLDTAKTDTEDIRADRFTDPPAVASKNQSFQTLDEAKLSEYLKSVRLLNAPLLLPLPTLSQGDFSFGPLAVTGIAYYPCVSI
jgi:hypothetical protein